MNTFGIRPFVNFLKLFSIVQVVFTTVEHSTYFIKVRHTYYF